jgi:hypothetical protein
MLTLRATLWAQLLTTLPLCGVIWLIQCLVYPQFLRVGAAEFVEYHAAHTRIMGYIVAPLMLAELAAAGAALLLAAPGHERMLAIFGAIGVFGIWAVTALLSVPAHNVLARGFDVNAVNMLVHTNWLRTLLWTARGVLVAYWLIARAN